MGIAVLHNGNLADARVRTYSGHWSKEKAASIISEINYLAIRHDASAIALKVNHPSRSSAWLLKISKGIERLADRNGIKLYVYSLPELTNQSTAKEMLEKLAKEYPETGYALAKGKHYRHYIKMFEAIASAKLGDKRRGQ